MKVCILGGAGFIGSHIVDTLWNNDIQDLTVIDDFSTGRRDNLNHDIEILNRDILGLGDFFKNNYGGREFDWVINCAAQVSTFESITNPEKDFQINAEGMFYLLESLRKADFNGVFIYTSSRSIYGDIIGFADESGKYQPSSIYNTNKYYGELLTRLYGKLYGLKYYIIRPSNVYGPRQPNAGLYNFCCRWISYVLQDKPIPIWGDGSQTRDFVFVEDIVDAYLKVIQQQPVHSGFNSGFSDDTFLLASGVGYTLLDLVNIILSELGKDFNDKTVQFKPPKAGDIQRFVGNPYFAKSRLGWEAKTDLKTGIKKTIEWVKVNMERYEDYNL